MRCLYQQCSYAPGKCVASGPCKSSIMMSIEFFRTIINDMPHGSVALPVEIVLGMTLGRMVTRWKGGNVLHLLHPTLDDKDDWGNVSRRRVFLIAERRWQTVRRLWHKYVSSPEACSTPV